MPALRWWASARCAVSRRHHDEKMTCFRSMLNFATAASPARQCVRRTHSVASCSGIASECGAVAVDFDETLTQNDTCSVLGHLAVRAAPPSQQVSRRRDHRPTTAACCRRCVTRAWHPTHAGCHVADARSRGSGSGTSSCSSSRRSTPQQSPSCCRCRPAQPGTPGTTLPLPCASATTVTKTSSFIASLWPFSRFGTFVAELKAFDRKANARLEGGALAGTPLHLPCISTAFVAKTAPLPCAFTAFVTKTAPFCGAPRHLEEAAARRGGAGSCTTGRGGCGVGPADGKWRRLRGRGHRGP